jgi:hypothetical protein
MSTATLANLDRANRLRWRARLLEQRAAAVMEAGDTYRAARMLGRAARLHLRADLALDGLTLPGARAAA